MTHLGRPEPAPVRLAPAAHTPLRLGNRPPLELDAGAVEVDNAMRWVVIAHRDDHTCSECAENDGKLYRNREDAYEDYPDGAGYINCVGAQYGNKCRCKVVKRRKGNDGED
jgi:hypothetical protein